MSHSWFSALGTMLLWGACAGSVLPSSQKGNEIDAGGSVPGDADGDGNGDGDQVGSNDGGTTMRDASVSNDKPPPKIIKGCDGLPPVGQWEQITPASVDLSTFGVISLSIVPNNQAVVYLGTTNSGLFKSEDCGANFVKVNTGALGNDLSKGSMHALIDPIEPNVIYTNSLYGTNGFFKSTNGGTDFVSVLPPEVSKYAPYGGFVGGYDMNPQNHRHVLVSWHQVCSPPFNSACYAETLDSGATWTMRNGDPSWNGGEGASLNFLDSSRWLFSSASNGMWLSKDQGESWTQLPMAKVAHGQGALLRMDNGSFFMGMADGVLYSADGEKWELMPNSGSLILGMATDGENIWASQAYPYNPDQRPGTGQRYWQGSKSNPTKWTRMEGAPMLSSGGCWLSYDEDHHILYSANYWDGLWRVVIK